MHRKDLSFFSVNVGTHVQWLQTPHQYTIALSIHTSRNVSAVIIHNRIQMQIVVHETRNNLLIVSNDAVAVVVVAAVKQQHNNRHHRLGTHGTIIHDKPVETETHIKAKRTSINPSFGVTPDIRDGQPSLDTHSSPSSPSSPGHHTSQE